MDKPYVAGVDIGGQTTKIGIVDTRGNVLAQTTIRSDSHTDALLYMTNFLMQLFHWPRT